MKSLNHYFAMPEYEIDMEMPPQEKQLVHHHIAEKTASAFIEERFKHIRRRYGKKIQYGASELSEDVYTTVTMVLGSVLYVGIAQMMSVILPDYLESVGILVLAGGITWLTKKSLTRLLALREVHLRTTEVENHLLSQLQDGANEFLKQHIHIQLNILRRVEKKPPILQDYVVVPAMVCEVAAALYRILIDADDLIVALLCASIPNLVMLVAAHLLSVKFEIPRLYWEILQEYKSLRPVQHPLLPDDGDDGEDDDFMGGTATPRSPHPLPASGGNAL